MHELRLGRITLELTQGKMSLAVERRLCVCVCDVNQSLPDRSDCFSLPRGRQPNGANGGSVIQTITVISKTCINNKV